MIRETQPLRGRESDRARLANGSFDGREIVSVFHGRGMPTIGIKSLRHIFRERQIGETFDGDAIVVIEINQFPEFEMTGQRCCF